MRTLPHRTPRTRTALAVSGALLLLLGTTACGTDDVAEQAAESAVERAIEDAASSSASTWTSTPRTAR